METTVAKLQPRKFWTLRLTSGALFAMSFAASLFNPSFYNDLDFIVYVTSGIADSLAYSHVIDGVYQLHWLIIQYLLPLVSLLLCLICFMTSSKNLLFWTTSSSYLFEFPLFWVLGLIYYISNNYPIYWEYIFTPTNTNRPLDWLILVLYSSASGLAIITNLPRRKSA